MDEQIDSTSQQPQAKISVIQTPAVVTTDVAARVATLFNGQNAQTKSIKSIKEVIPLAGEDGNPALYVVNYADNQGYAIISANNQYQPIIAYNETGNYDIHAQDGSSVLLDEHLYALQHIEALPDSVQLAFKRQWNQYFMSEEPLMLSTTETKASGETFEEEEYRVGVYIEQTLNEWSNEGYEIIPYIGNEERYFTTEEIQQINNYLMMNAEDRYFDGFNNTVFIRIKSSTSSSSVSPLLETTWNQTGGYATYTSNGYAGCGPVAAGQIMKYHEYPIMYDWDGMADTYATDKTAAFLAELGSRMDASYDSDGTGTTISNIRNALKSYGYTNSKIVNGNDYADWEAQLDTNRPILMTGVAKADTAHAWVCDGYQNSATEYNCEVMGLDKAVMDHTNQPQYRVMYSGRSYDIYKWYHMNWGWGGDENGYWSIYTPEDYPNNRKNIIDIYPVQ